MRWSYNWTCKKKGDMHLEESINFDNIQRHFCVSICLLVVCESYDDITVVKRLSPTIVCQSKNMLFWTYNFIMRKKFTVRNTARITALLA